MPYVQGAKRLHFDLAQAALGDLDRAGKAADTLSAATGAVDRNRGEANSVATVGLGITAGAMNDDKANLE